MKKFYWKAIIKEMGKRKFVWFIIWVFITAVSTVILIKDIGLTIVLESIGLSYIISSYEELNDVVNKVNEYYTVETKKDKKKEEKMVSKINKHTK